jgi:hypothetical protein
MSGGGCLRGVPIQVLGVPVQALAPFLGECSQEIIPRRLFPGRLRMTEHG